MDDDDLRTAREAWRDSERTVWLEVGRGRLDEGSYRLLEQRAFEARRRYYRLLEERHGYPPPPGLDQPPAKLRDLDARDRPSP